MTPEQFNHAAIAAPPRRFAHLERLFESWASPRQFHAAPARLEALGSPEQAERLRRGLTWSWLERAGRLHDFDRQDLSDDVTFYRQNRPDRATQHKHLIVAMTARGGRLTLPIAPFLQSLPLHTESGQICDVLVLRDRWQAHYRFGCEGFAADFAALARKVGALASTYNDATALGTSMGGLPAIRLGSMARLNRAISIGGRQWDDVQRIAQHGRRLPAFDPLCACANPGTCEPWFVSADGHEKDCEVACHHARIWGGQAIVLPRLKTHHVLGEAWLNGNLPQVLAQLLNPSAR